MHVLNDNPMWGGIRPPRPRPHGVWRRGYRRMRFTLERIGNGTREDWYREWTRTAERVYSIARICESAGHRVSAREAYFRASTYFHLAYFPLFGAPGRPLARGRFIEGNGRLLPRCRPG